MQNAKHPNFFILGAQKAGTTYLAQVLSQHPEVFFSEPKETMFFSKKLERNAERYAEYLKEYFGEAQSQPWRGEGSTTYLQWSGVIEEVQRFVPGKPKFIVCLRQPLAKAISFYVHNWRRDRYAPGTTLTETLDLPVQSSPFASSLYAESIERWLKAFPREDFLFLKFDLLQENPSGFVNEATKFLGIEPVSVVTEKKVNAGLPLVWEDGALTISQRAAGDKVDKRPYFFVSELEHLQDRFLDDLNKTEELTGLDLSSWKQMPEL